MASCGFVAVIVAYCCQNRSEMWSNANIQKLQIFFVVLTSFSSFISECSISSREFWSITDLRFNLEIFVFSAVVFVQNHSNETHFHMNDFARRLVLRQRQSITRKWPIMDVQCKL